MSQLVANEIIPNLFIGGSDSSYDADFIKKANISVIINCTKDLKNHFEPIFLSPIESAPQEVQNWITANSIKYYRLPIDDNLKDSEMEAFYNLTKKLMPLIYHEYFHGKSILVHCLAGSQRSCAFVAVFLMSLLEKNFNDIKEIIVKKRPQAFFFGSQVNFQEPILRFQNEFNH